MATTANHPDGGGSFVGPSEPDEDIAAIAKQISDHAEVIYQTWKARGLAPNEILTCHNNLNAADKFGSVLTGAFSPSGQNGRKSPANLQVMDFLYNNGAAAGGASPATTNAANLEQFVNKFVVEDRARLAARQKGEPPAAPNVAKNYPSSIQYALQKFERRSPPAMVADASGGVAASSKLRNAGSPTKTTSFAAIPKATHLPEERHPPEQFIPVSNAPQMVKPGIGAYGGTSTWPLKTRPLELASHDADSHDGYDDAHKCSTLPSRMERRSSEELPSRLERKSPDELSSRLERRSSDEEFLDEVAKEQERLINALKTGIVITANESKSTSGFTPAAKTVNEKAQKKVVVDDAKVCDSLAKLRSKKINSLTEKVDNAKKMDVTMDTVCGVSGVSSKRNRRNGPIDVGNPETNGISPRLNLKAGTTNGSANVTGNPMRPFLTRGSVAERVMMFEKCPTEILEKRTKANSAGAASWKNLASDVHSKIQVRNEFCGFEYLLLI